MNHPNRREVIKATAALPLAYSGIAPLSAHAQTSAYPSKPVTLVLTTVPGNLADIIGRLIAHHLGESLGQQVVVDNRPGAGGIIAIKHAASAAPDGYTMLYLGAGAAISQALFKPQPYDVLESFVPVSTVTSNDILLLVRKQSPFNSVGDFIRESKKVKGGLMVGVGMPGTMQHISAELFKHRTQTEMTIVPFKSTATMATSLAAGDIDLAFEFLPASLTYIRSNQLRALALVNAKRSEVFPDVPSVAESGYPGFNISSWGAFVVPAKTPEAIVQRLHKEVRAALAKPELKQRMLEMGVRVPADTQEQVRDLMVSEIPRWKNIVHDLKISLK